MEQLFIYFGIWSNKVFSWADILGLFLFIAGFIIGLGAVTVIDLHGFLGRKSSYWTEATIRTHKVTKPLIWIGIFLAILGGLITYRHIGFSGISLIHAVLAVVLILNGTFLSFWVSPRLLMMRERGKSTGTSAFRFTDEDRDEFYHLGYRMVEQPVLTCLVYRCLALIIIL